MHGEIRVRLIYRVRSEVVGMLLLKLLLLRLKVLIRVLLRLRLRLEVKLLPLLLLLLLVLLGLFCCLTSELIELKSARKKGTESATK